MTLRRDVDALLGRALSHLRCADSNHHRERATRSARDCFRTTTGRGSPFSDDVDHRTWATRRWALLLDS
jgi:hypothetical protein